jgi:peptidylprolyl isomerase
MHAAMPRRTPMPQRRRLAAIAGVLAAGLLATACGANGEGAPPEAGCPVNTTTCTTASGAASAAAPTPTEAPDPCFTKPTPSPVPGGDAFCTSVVIGTTTADGLGYGDIKPGSGPTPQKGQKVTVQYTGWLKSTGVMFDSSRLPGRSPFQFTLGGQVIKGWNEGVATMQLSGKRRFIIPPALGYGAQGSPPTIPANSTLVFDVELLSIG